MNIKKMILYGMSITAVAAVSVFGTLAYLTDRDSAVNTFTVGKVDITLDEADVNPNGTPIEDAERVQANDYHLIPGQTYVKDPTVTVKADSEESYVRMLVTLNCKSQLDAIFAPGVALTAIFNGYDASNWIFEEETADATANTVTYEFRYKETVDPADEDVVLDALFDSFTVPGTLDGDDLQAIEALTITVEGHAIQSAGFDTEDAAWDAFEVQNNNS